MARKSVAIKPELCCQKWRNKYLEAACVGRYGSISESPWGLKLLPFHRYAIYRGDPHVAVTAPIITSHLHSRQRMKDRVEKKKVKRYKLPIFYACSFEASHHISTYYLLARLSHVVIPSCRRSWEIQSLFWGAMSPARSLGFPLLCK